MRAWLAAAGRDRGQLTLERIGFARATNLPLRYSPQAEQKWTALQCSSLAKQHSFNTEIFHVSWVPAAPSHARTADEYLRSFSGEGASTMRVQHRLPSPPFHPHAHQTAPAPQDYAQAQPNGVHSDPSRPRYSASTTDHLNTEDMYSQAHSYGAGNGQPQQHYQQHPQHQQQRQYAPQNENQLPPMHNGMMPPNMSMPPPSQGSGQGVAGPSSGQHPVLYPATSSGLPQPGARALEAQNTVSTSQATKLQAGLAPLLPRCL